MGRGFMHMAVTSALVLSLAACVPATKQARLLMDEGRYDEAARKLSSSPWPDPSSKKDRAEVYSGAINGLIDKGDSRMKLKDYDKAGIAYRKARDYYPSDISVAGKIKLSERELTEKIGTCSNALMEAGLLKYRAGQIEGAIGIWNSIILFDPQNAEAIKALDTATIQLRNLRKLN
jgi:tetratricopeptide (TPR) repeat protein